MHKHKTLICDIVFDLIYTETAASRKFNNTCLKCGRKLSFCVNA